MHATKPNVDCSSTKSIYNQITKLIWKKLKFTNITYTKANLKTSTRFPDFSKQKEREENPEPETSRNDSSCSVQQLTAVRR